MRIEDRAERLRGGCLATLACCLLAACHPATAQSGAAPTAQGGAAPIAQGSDAPIAQDSSSSCAAPAPWQEANAKPGQPQAELAACLSDQAYQTRNLAVPVESATAGIVAQCEIRVDRLEGHVGAAAPDQAADQAAMAQAKADVTQYRQCAGH